MPAQSKAQQIAMAIAEHEPDKLYSRNKGMLEMSHSQLHDFASTPRKRLPDYSTMKNALLAKRPKKPAMPKPKY